MRGMTTVLCFGTFDNLHPGHEFYLKAARQHGDRLVVIVSRDETVRSVKGKLPIQTERERLGAVSNLSYVDEAKLGYTGDKMRVVQEVNPDVICLGYDQTSFVDELKRYLRERREEITVVRIPSHHPEEYKSSRMQNNLYKQAAVTKSMDIYQESLEMHAKHKGKIEVISKVKVEDKKDLSLAYTPGVAEPCRQIHKNKELVYKYTIKGNTVAVVSDGSSVLGLGNIGPEAAIPVMEGKALLFKEFAGIDAFPICLDTQDPKEIIAVVKAIAPMFGGINLEDIAAPKCFEIEEALQDIGIPVMHDDQHGTAVVVLAGLLNAVKVTGKEFSKLTIVINGAGAAGIAVAKFLTDIAHDVILCDSVGIIHKDRESLNPVKREMVEITNKDNSKGLLADALNQADVFIGVSKGNLLTPDMVHRMNKNPIIFAMANPDPEILPDAAKKAGAAVVCTGRSDYPNQVNNVLAFPGIFKGALMARAPRITRDMKLAAAKALAEDVKNPTAEMILPSPLDKGVASKVAEAVRRAA